MRLAHAPTALTDLRTPTSTEPLRVLLSGCLMGLPCGVDGSDNGMGGVLTDLVTLPTVKVFSFCPEDYALGTPRTLPDIHGGDGSDVLDGKARVLDEHGKDLTEGMIRGAQAMLSFAQAHQVELAILTDMSAACGSQVISDGCRLETDRKYQMGVGVSTALLLRNGFPVVSQRDFRTLGKIRMLLEPGFSPDPEALDHHEKEWYRTYFQTSPAQ